MNPIKGHCALPYWICKASNVAASVDQFTFLFFFIILLTNNLSIIQNLFLYVWLLSQVLFEQHAKKYTFIFHVWYIFLRFSFPCSFLSLPQVDMS